jgi:hypothetical protein
VCIQLARYELRDKDLFEIFPDLPWRIPDTQQPAPRKWSPPFQPPQSARDALRGIRIIAVNERSRLGAKSGRSHALDQIIAMTDAALRSAQRKHQRGVSR